MKISANITTVVALLLSTGPILAARNAEDDGDNEKDWVMLRGRARVKADDIVVKADVKAHDIVVETGVKADNVVVEAGVKKADDVASEAGVKDDDIVVEAGVKADDAFIKHGNSHLRLIYNDYMAWKQRNLVPAEGFVDDGNFTYDDNSTDTGNLTKGDNSTDVGNILDGGKFTDYLVWKDDYGIAKLIVEVIAQGEGAEALLQPAFEAYGFEKTGCSAYQCSGFLLIENFEGFAARPEVRAVRPFMIDSQQVGSKHSEAVVSLKVDLARKVHTSLLGTGLKIGILSDSFNVLGGYAQDVFTGDLPYNVKVLQEGPPFNPITKTPADEGRAMAQLIHDIAPGAEIYFHSSNLGPDSIAIGIQELADVGCNVVVDDIANFNQPFFQDGIIAKSANDVAQWRGVPYFSSAGNDAAQSWEGTFKGSDETSAGCVRHDFGAAFGFKSTRQKIITSEAFVRIIFQWDEPFFSVSGPPGAARDMDIRLYKDGILLENDNDVDLGVDAFARVTTGLPGTYELELSLCTPLIPGASPPRMKWVGYGGKIVDIQFQTSSSSSWGHKNQPYVAAVGAAHFYDTSPFNGGFPHKLAPSSSRGGTPIYFDRRGARLAGPEIRPQPRFVATDGDITTFFGDDLILGPSGGGKYFFGTSAAASNTAAVALLMLQVNPKLKPLEVYDMMARTAIDMGVPGWDYDTGSGYIDANAAVNMAISLLAPPPQPAPPKVKTVPTTKAQKKAKAPKPKKKRKPRKRT